MSIDSSNTSRNSLNIRNHIGLACSCLVVANLLVGGATALLIHPRCERLRRERQEEYLAKITERYDKINSYLLDYASVQENKETTNTYSRNIEPPSG